MKLFLGRPWWQGVAAIVGVLSVGVTVAVAILQDDPPQPITVQNNVISGDGNKCNAQGIGATANCTVLPTTPARLGDVSIAWPYASYYLFAGPVSALPTPPPFGPDDLSGHCDVWADWLAAQPRVYGINPAIEVGMTSGEAEVVAITSIEPKVFNRKPLPKDSTIFRCQFGSGGDAGFRAAVDTRSLKTEVHEFNQDLRFSIPPGSLKLSGQESASGQIVLASEPYFLYEGSLVITAKINGVPEEIVLGSIERPIRWVRSEPDSPNRPWRTEDEYRWNSSSNKWAHELPFS
ncbi:hypothetical protein [Herbidospora sp. RD11066]